LRVRYEFEHDGAGLFVPEDHVHHLKCQRVQFRAPARELELVSRVTHNRVAKKVNKLGTDGHAWIVGAARSPPPEIRVINAASG
jgi:hypothetical protein